MIYIIVEVANMDFKDDIISELSYYDITIHRESNIFPYLYGEAPSIMSASAARSIDGVVDITADRIKTIQPLPGLEDPSKIKRMQELSLIMEGYEAYKEGYRGEGIRIAVLDTGINSNHPMMRGTVIYKGKWANGDLEDGINKHGTHIGSTIAGNWVYTPHGAMSGIVPEAKLLNIKIMDDDGVGDDTAILMGLEDAVENGADIINMSLGTPQYRRKDALMKAVEMVSKLGIQCVCAAGNGEMGGRIHTPGAEKYAITVGSFYVHNGEFIVNNFSHGPAFDGTTKPDIVSYGAVYAAVEDDDFKLYEGTSMATATFSGSMAQVMQANGGRRISRKGWEKLLYLTGGRLSYKENDMSKSNIYGYGIPDVWDMIDKLDKLEENEWQVLQ